MPQKTKSAPQMRENFMSKEDLTHKLHEEKTRRLNAERRVDYWKDKIDNEMTTFVQEDHNDFLHMFKMLQKDSLENDMKLFWEAQEKALLLQHKSKEYRWHPKCKCNDFLCFQNKRISSRHYILSVRRSWVNTKLLRLISFILL